jgi:hypothetical protein
LVEDIAMAGCRAAWIVLAGLTVAWSGGCQKPFQLRPSDPLGRLPPSLPPTPSLADITRVVNANASQIRSFSSNQASLSGTGFPALRANIAFERPQRLRLRGDLSLIGAMVDVGCNDDLFWFWAKPNQPSGVYYCRHDDYAGSPAKQNIPVDPYWLLDALGLAEFPANLQHVGPHPLSGNRWAVQTIRQTPDGPARRTTIVDGRLGLVLEQHIYDAKNQRIATALSGKFHQDPTTRLFMPRSVKIQCPPRPGVQEFSLQLDMADLQINRELPSGAALWQMPAIDGSPPINLCRTGGAPPTAPAGTIPTGAVAPVQRGLLPAGQSTFSQPGPPALMQPGQPSYQQPALMQPGQPGQPSLVQPGPGPGPGFGATAPSNDNAAPAAPASPSASRPYWRQ